MPIAEWARIVQTTTHDYIREEEINIMRNRKLLAMLQARGRVTFGHSGDMMDWKIRYKRAPLTGYADGDILSFSRQQRWQTAQLEYRGYSVADSVTKKEQLMNRGTEAIVKFYSETSALLMEDVEDQFCEELYVDGNAAGNTKKIHGAESYFGNGGAGTKNPIGVPSDSYAGINTDLGNYGGSWSANGATVNATTGDWPSGTGDAHFDFWSPLIVDYTSAISTSNSNGTFGWTSGTKTWPNTNKEAIRFGLTFSRKNKGRRGQVDLVMLDNQLYRQLAGTIDSAENIFVMKGKGGLGSEANLVSLGFGDVINFEGCEITAEYGIPANVGYGFSLSNIELCSMQDSLFVPEGPSLDLGTKSYRYSIDFFGNLRFNPRFHFKLQAVS